MNSSMSNPAGESMVIQTGDVIMLKSHTGTYISVRDSCVCSQFEDPKPFHMFMTEKSQPGPINSGDVIFLKAHDGKCIDVEGDSVQARYSDRGTWQQLTIEKDGPGCIRAGDAVFLKTHTGKHIDVHGNSVKARWQDQGEWQKLIIQKVRVLSLSDLTGARGQDVRESTLRGSDSLAASSWEFVDSTGSSIDSEAHEAVRLEYQRGLQS